MKKTYVMLKANSFPEYREMLMDMTKYTFITAIHFGSLEIAMEADDAARFIEYNYRNRNKLLPFTSRKIEVEENDDTDYEKLWVDAVAENYKLRQALKTVRASLDEALAK